MQQNLHVLFAMGCSKIGRNAASSVTGNITNCQTVKAPLQDSKLCSLLCFDPTRFISYWFAIHIKHEKMSDQQFKMYCVLFISGDTFRFTPLKNS